MTKRLNIVNDQSIANYDAGNKVIYNTEVSILVKYDITIIGHQVTQVAFKNCALFINSITKIDGTTINDTENLDLVIQCTI